MGWKVRELRWKACQRSTFLALFSSVCLWIHAETDQTLDPKKNRHETRDFEKVDHQGELSHPLSDSEWRLLDARTLEELYFIDNIFERSAALYIYLQDTDEVEMQGHLRNVEAFDSERRRGGPFDIFVARYADLNPRATFEYLDSQGERFVYQFSSVLFHVWGRNNLNEAVQFVETLPFPLRQSCARTILRVRDDLSRDELDHIALRLGVDDSWAQIKTSRESSDPGFDPARSIEVLLANASEHEIFMEIDRIVKEWVETDPQAAFDFIDASIESQERRTQLMKRALDELAKSDPGSALDLVQGVARADRDKLAEGILESWMAKDKASAFAAIEAISNTRLKIGALRFFLVQIAESDPHLGYEYMVSSSTENDVLRHDVLTALSKVSPRQAVRLLGTFDSSSMAKVAAQSVVGHWCSGNLNECIAWYEAEASENMKKDVIRQVVLSFASQDVSEATQWVNSRAVGIDEELRESLMKLVRSFDIYKTLQN